MMRWVDYDLGQVLRLYLPVSRRGARFLALIKWLASGTGRVKALFDAFRIDFNGQLPLNGGRLALERFLQVRFADARIRVINTPVLRVVPFLGTDAEDGFLFCGTDDEYDADPTAFKIFAPTDAELLQRYDFTVDVPADAAGVLSVDVEAAVGRLVLAGRRFRVARSGALPGQDGGLGGF